MGRQWRPALLVLTLLLGFIAILPTLSPLVQAGARAIPSGRSAVYLPALFRPKADALHVDPETTMFGLAFVNSAEEPRGDARIQRGVAAGAKWDRFPLYWNRIEARAGEFDWRQQDAALRANERKGLTTLAILLGTPQPYYPASLQIQGERPMPPVGGGPLRAGLGEVRADGSCVNPGPPAPRGLFEPIFTDGSDRPAPGKGINPANPWARFVHEAVQRYRPGGSAGLKVRYWEIWNEEDLCQFWSGSVQEYVRLLKVAYIVIKQSDPQATVMWGGLTHWGNAQFLYEMLNALKADPLALEMSGFFDAAASHHYSTSRHGYDYTARIRSALAATPWANKPIWITESGVPVCDDYPGPPCPSPYRANPLEQASYIWQNVAETRLAGGGPIFHFQLHDDCGNVVAPNSPDGFGLVKNESNSYCSPSNAEARLSYTAYTLAVRYFENTDVLWGDVQGGKVRRVAFYHPETRERRLLVWAIDGSDATARVPATGTAGRLISLEGQETTVTPDEGEYLIPVPRATNQNQPNSSAFTIGGRPYLLIERDTLPPSGSIAPLAPTSPRSFAVRWDASDPGSGVTSVAVWTQQGNGPWQPWLSGQPASGSATFTGEPGQCYRFAMMATDRAGNAPAAPASQAETCISGTDPTPTPAPRSEDLIRNGGFETDQAWLFGETAARGDYTTSPVHAGRRAVRLGVEPPAGDPDGRIYSSVSQTVTIPADVTSATLSLWVRLQTEDDRFSPGAVVDNTDVQQVVLLDENRNFKKLLWAASQNSEEWQQLRFKLGDYFANPRDYAGQTIVVYINAINDGDGRRTWLYLDDASLIVTRPSG